MEEIAQALGISHGSVSTMLHDRLGMRKLTARWVSKSLSGANGNQSIRSVCSALLKRFRSKDDFLLHLVTVDETWVHYYEPENKAQSSVGRAWVPEAKEVQDATICWQGDGHSILDAKGVIMLDFSPKRSTITGVYYANLLDQLRTAIHEKRRGKPSKGVSLQQDNARVHTCKVAMDAVE